MELRIFVFLFLLSLCRPSVGKEKTFACHARGFGLESFRGQPSVWSPNHQRRIQLRKDYSFAVLSGDKQLATLEYRDVNCCIEIGWSPNSNQFFVSYSDSATYSQYKVHLFTIVAEQVSENRAVQGVSEDFSSRHSCPSRVLSGNNLFLLGWTQDSKRVLLVAEVEPTGDCGKEAGVYEGFLVNAMTGSIIRRYVQSETSKIERSCRLAGVLPREMLY